MSTYSSISTVEFPMFTMVEVDPDTSEEVAVLVEFLTSEDGKDITIQAGCLWDRREDAETFFKGITQSLSEVYRIEVIENRADFEDLMNDYRLREIRTFARNPKSDEVSMTLYSCDKVAVANLLSEKVAKA